MNKIRNNILNKQLEHMDEETKRIYKIAESICRKEYEKAFNFDLDLPIGHPKNSIGIEANNPHKPLMEIIEFWMALKKKYEGKCNDALSRPIAYFCDVHISRLLNTMGVF